MIDLVAGYARGYTALEIRPFLKTLRDTGYKGRILLVADGGAAVEAGRWDVDVRPCPRPSGGMLPHSARFVELAKMVEPMEWEGLFLADTRDIIFQEDITHTLPSTGLNVYEEDADMTLGSCPYNSLWIQLGYGQEVLEKMKMLPISCVGTVCGSRLEMVPYLDLLSAEVKRCQPKTRKPQDQSSHNWLIHRVLNPIIYPNEVGEVYTVGYIRPRNTVQIVDGKIVNRAGKVPAVIHQWDRHINLKAHVEGLL